MILIYILLAILIAILCCIKAHKKKHLKENQFQDMILYSFLANPKKWKRISNYYNHRWYNNEINTTLVLDIDKNRYNAKDHYTYSAYIIVDGEKMILKTKHRKKLSDIILNEQKEKKNKEKLDSYNKSQMEKLKRED
jgi:hypothetical protein